MNENNEVHPKIAHLSSEQIEALYDEYLSDIKVIDLIEKYNIDVTPSGLVRLFPPLKLDDNHCPYCEVAMYKKRASKTSYSEHPPKCIECGHVESIIRGSGWNICRCEGCLAFRLEEANKKSELRTQIIAKKYDPEVKKRINYEDVKLKDKLSLLSLLLMQSDDKFKFILPLNDSLRVCEFTPTNRLNVKYLQSLYKTGCLIVDPSSKVESFSEESEYEDFYINRVQWLNNISIMGEERSSIKELFKKLHQDLVERPLQGYEDIVLELMQEIAVEEVIQNIYMRSKELSVDFTAEDKTRTLVKELLASFSVSEIYYFVKKAVEGAHLYYQKGGAKNKRHAGNTIPNKMLSLGQRSISESWKRYEYNRHHDCPRSQISKVLYEVIFKDEDAGFSKCIHQYWQIHIQVKTDKLDSGNQILGMQCLECSSENIQLGMNKKNIEIICQDCGVTSSFAEQS
tara:strand:- start:1794 stop:3161 length:1368 start_codon:yes stop_codon:yes gene_type:complete